MGAVRKIREDTLVVQTAGLIAADMDGVKVMLNIENGKYYGLDGIGSRVWELIEKSHTVGELVAALTKEYDVDETTCQNDVVRFLNQLCAKGLVQIE